ncbi:MAG: chemotaxis protein CheB [Pseudomonadota bacterium]
MVQNFPKDANAIYIVAQHMSPTHKSLLSSLNSRETVLKVEELHKRTKPKPDRIYVTPPNKDVIVKTDFFRCEIPVVIPQYPSHPPTNCLKA